MITMRFSRSQFGRISSAVGAVTARGLSTGPSEGVEPPRSGPKPLTLATLNTYLIPPFLSKRHSSLPETHRALTRAARISNFLADYGTDPATTANGPKRPIDLAFFQEVWGPGTDLLNRTPGFESGPAETRSVVTESWSNLLPATLIKTPWDWWRMWNAATGGLWFSARVSSLSGSNFASERHRPLWTKRHTYTISATPSRKGVLGSLWDVSSLWGKEHRYLLVFTTHLDAWNDQNKGKQLSEMANFVRENILTEVRTVLENKEKEGWGGKPENWTKGPIGAFHADPLSRLAVLFVGDFNIAAPVSTDSKVDSAAGSHSALYKDTLLQMMGSNVPPLVDYYAVVHEGRGSPSVGASSYDKINNTLVEPGPGNHGRIDQILGMTSIWDDVSGKSIELMRLECTDIEIVRQQPALELSDHYPVIATFVPLAPSSASSAT